MEDVNQRPAEDKPQPASQSDREPSDGGNSRGKMGLGAIIKSIARGEVLFTLKFDRYFPHIVYFFFLIIIGLMIDFQIEQTMVKSEQNKFEIYELRIRLNQKRAELISLGRMSKVQEMLQATGSDLGIPSAPATRIKE